MSVSLGESETVGVAPVGSVVSVSTPVAEGVASVSGEETAGVVALGVSPDGVVSRDGVMMSLDGERMGLRMELTRDSIGSKISTEVGEGVVSGEDMTAGVV